MKITVIGTGYVGLVTGTCFAYMGNKVTCLDIDKKKINNLTKGIVPIFEPGLEKIVKQSISNNTLSFSSNTKESIINSDIIFIAVGTPMYEDGSSNLEYVYRVSEDIGKYLNSHKIIITKSTIPVGTTNKVKEIILKMIDGRKENLSFDICNNPEFLKEGKAVDDFMSPDRIIIGLENQKLKKVLTELYKPFSMNHKKIIFMDILSSEFTKYASNAMLATKISFINEMAIIADKVGADINEVRVGIGSDSRIGYSFIYPSVGYGGSCFPKDIYSILNFSKNEGYEPKILKAVNEVNKNQKKYFFNKILKRFIKKGNSFANMKFAIWGLAFKPGTDDMRESPSIYFVKSIIKLGGTVSVYDPKAMINAKENYFKGMNNINYCSNKMEALIDCDALVLITEWPEFRTLDFKEMIDIMKNPIFFDGRNQFDKYNMKKNGIEYHQIGVNSL